MRYPPALTYTPVRSRVYCIVVALLTIILIALGADSMLARGHFSLKNSLFMGLAAVASLWLLRNACRQPRGQLKYAQGQWMWLHAGQEMPGTLRLHLDLQNYLLVSFVAHQHHNRLQLTRTQWFHLEARHLPQAVNSSSWVALRRAVVAQVEPEREAVAV